MDALNTGPFDSTGVPKHIADHLVLVMKVASTASQGLKSAETITIAWDEI